MSPVKPPSDGDGTGAWEHIESELSPGGMGRAGVSSTGLHAAEQRAGPGPADVELPARQTARELLSAMEATLLDTLSAEFEVRERALEQLAQMLGDDPEAFFRWISGTLAGEGNDPRLRQAAGIALKDQRLGGRAPAKPSARRPKPPPRRKSGKKVSRILNERRSARRHVEAEAEAEMDAGGLPPIHRLQMELVDALAAEEKLAQGVQNRAAETLKEHGFDRLPPSPRTPKQQQPDSTPTFGSRGTASRARSGEAVHTARPAKTKTDAVWVEALAERKKHHSARTESTWKRGGGGQMDPAVAAWLAQKEGQDTSARTLDLVNWILILVRQGSFTEAKLQETLADYGSISEGWLRMIRGAMRTVAYSDHLQDREAVREKRALLLSGRGRNRRSKVPEVTIAGKSLAHWKDFAKVAQGDARVGVLPTDEGSRGSPQQRVAFAMMDAVRDAAAVQGAPDSLVAAMAVESATPRG